MPRQFKRRVQPWPAVGQEVVASATARQGARKAASPGWSSSPAKLHLVVNGGVDL